MGSLRRLSLIALAVLSMRGFVSASDSVNIYQMAVTGVPVPSLGVAFTSFTAPTTDRQVDFDTGEDPYFFHRCDF